MNRPCCLVTKFASVLAKRSSCAEEKAQLLWPSAVSVGSQSHSATPASLVCRSQGVLETRGPLPSQGRQGSTVKSEDPRGPVLPPGNSPIPNSTNKWQLLQPILAFAARSKWKGDIFPKTTKKNSQLTYQPACNKLNCPI